ncbi:serine/threonine protein kinase, partial [bacterium AH-315-F18]|nr:serine/threonine protein kinase [bacterium AH-315-F18]
MPDGDVTQPEDALTLASDPDQLRTLKVPSSSQLGDDAPTITSDERLVAVGKGAGKPRERIGNYEILDRIAQGGMGVVYKARQSGLDRVVALKVILTGEHASAEEIARFRSEATAAAKLKHPGIVGVLDIGQDDQGRDFFTMDYIEGRGLDHALVHERITAEQAARWCAKTARALDHAHKHGVVHRDIKPSNILLDENDEPHVTDFGLAKEVATDSGLTLSGMALGTPAYMPPEQAEGRLKDIGPPSDVYALGATLYELLTLERPFQGGSVGEIIKKLLTEEPRSPRKIVPSLARDLEVITLKAMHKEPRRRYATALAMAEDLEAWAAGRPIEARPVGRLERSYKWMGRNKGATAALAMVVLALVGAIGMFVWQWDQSRAHRLKLRGLLADAKSLMDVGGYREAQRRFQEALALDLNNAEAKQGMDIARRREEDQRKKAEAVRLVAEADMARAEWSEFTRRLEMLRADLVDKERTTPGHLSLGGDRKKALIALRNQVAGEGERAQRRFVDMISDYQRALSLDPEQLQARAALAGIYWTKWTALGVGGDRARRALNMELCKYYDQDVNRYTPRFGAGARLTFDTSPSAAAVYLYRYEREGPRLVPRPWMGRVKAPPASEGELNLETGDHGSRVYPLKFGPKNYIGRTPIKAYLLPP